MLVLVHDSMHVLRHWLSLAPVHLVAVVELLVLLLHFLALLFGFRFVLSHQGLQSKKARTPRGIRALRIAVGATATH